MTSIDKRPLRFAFLLICFGFLWFFGITSLKGRPIANDEFNTLARIRQIGHHQPYSLPETLEKLAAISPDHGPLYFLLMNLWQRIAGADLFSMRLPSVFFGMLSLATVYRLALLGGRQEAGLAAAGFLGFLSFFLYYTQLARMYTLLALVVGGIVWSYWKVSRGGAPGWIWRLLFVTTAAVTYIHYSGLMLLSTVALYHLVFARKDRRWWRIAFLMSAAVLLFIPWLPVVIVGLEESSVLSDNRLPLLESLGAGLSVFSNGIVILPLAAGTLLARYRKRLNPPEQYIALVTLLALLVMLLLNEITPVLVESRLRYLTFIAAPAASVIACGLHFSPGWKRLRIVWFGLWVLASFAFWRSDYFNVVTNRQALLEDKLVHYQAFRYDLRDLPGYDQLIISFHPQAPVVWKTIEYYRAILDKWKYIVHITYDEAGDLLVQSGIPPRLTQSDIVAESDGIWVIHNPQQTDLSSMDVYENWFLDHFKPCKRFVDEADTVIAFYLRRSLPCGLAFADEPLAILYDNGGALDNILVERTQDELSVYFWWREIIEGEYSFSLQIFDEQSNRVAGSDAVIRRAPLDLRRLDISALPAGAYTLQLIVYHFETGASVSGRVAGNQEPFERAVQLTRFTVGD
ncbi:MAG: glycosyltransferase family 39 protein [Chloroflexota bacterium]|nr:glycosyltransferase family 39 protein [Chloroflexota bacterium]